MRLTAILSGRPYRRCLLLLACPLIISASDDGDPPVVKEKILGHDVWYQRWELGQTEVGLKAHPIALGIEMWRGVEPEQDGFFHVNLTCRIKDDGEVALSNEDCESSCVNVEGHPSCRSVAEMADLDQIAWPSFDPIKQRRGIVFNRWAIFELLIPSDLRPGTIDADGPVLEWAEATAQGTRIPITFPSRAVRQAKGGVATFHCDIQMDYSALCHLDSFDPTENAFLFESSVRSIGWKVSFEKTLPDGSSSVGRRVQGQVNFVVH